jgi:L-fuconolactonase
MKIDCHQHFWNYDPSVDLWITDEMKTIGKDFLPEDLEPLLKQTGFVGCIAVQSRQTEADTNFLLALAEQHDFIKGVVGWIDLRSPKLEERLEHFTQFKKLKGFRHVIQAEPAGFMTHHSFLTGVNNLHHFNFTYDLLIKHNQLGEALKFVERVPETRIVLDHIGKPSIKRKEISDWKAKITSLGTHRHVYCKISGMVTETDWSNWQAEDFFPYLDVITESFGPDRIMYGSDWPVCLLAGSYQQQFQIVEKYFSSFSIAVRDKVFGLNAVKFYHLNGYGYRNRK